ncbi:methyltransferase domain-containing protein [Cognatishimia maritima]|uniref:Methyltransferase domain-containing protein n=1 Tax=Cognatishimia maritima TaxID=870908 RepID=A0A1M5WDB4_9RHOB|nr:class I SAM-dependent methyltransferase [Cognatishimia maritima]SHH85450.1 Methyltransferase domain-containing protein [Cognatishimia maritima]
MEDVTTMSISKQSGQALTDILPLLRSPLCQASFGSDALSDDGLCAENGTKFPIIDSQPVLVNFENSILDRDSLLASKATSLIGPRPVKRQLWKRILLGRNTMSPKTAQDLAERLRSQVPDPVVLIIGGGTVSDGAEVLYQTEGLRIISFDVYATPNTDFVADAHDIPLKDQSVDAVWIEAVLEHVLSPHDVVEEIWRVLKPDGLVYAGTPFLQPVHERAYDFTRFTENGHRWLFRRFNLIESGVVAGPGTALFQILRYAAGALLGSRRWGSRLTAPFFWLRFIDLFSNRAHASDAASGVYFFGQKSQKTLKPKDMPGEFRGVR